jgi:hypothetical protein
VNTWGQGKSGRELRALALARAMAQEAVVRCALCSWRHEGLAGDGIAAARAHRRAEHPGARQRKRERSVLHRVSPEAAERGRLRVAEAKRRDAA